MWFYRRVMTLKDADRTAHSVDIDQTAPLRVVKEQSDLGVHCLHIPVDINQTPPLRVV